LITRSPYGVQDRSLVRSADITSDHGVGVEASWVTSPWVFSSWIARLWVTVTYESPDVDQLPAVILMGLSDVQGAYAFSSKVELPTSCLLERLVNIARLIIV